MSEFDGQQVRVKSDRKWVTTDAEREVSLGLETTKNASADGASDVAREAVARFVAYFILDSFCYKPADSGDISARRSFSLFFCQPSLELRSSPTLVLCYPHSLIAEPDRTWEPVVP